MGGGDVEEPQLCQTFQGFPHLGFGALFFKNRQKSNFGTNRSPKMEKVRKPARARNYNQKPSKLNPDWRYGRILSEKAMHEEHSFKVAPGGTSSDFFTSECMLTV